jgi:hypothetical protein
VALPPGVPSLASLFTFARDAELRFDTLKLRIEERTNGGRGDRVVEHDVAIRHPGQARVLVTEPALETAANHEIWLSDGEVVRTYAARHRSATARPIRPRLRGLDQPDLPPSARVYAPLTPLPPNTLPDTFVHPGNYCQNVLATGRCRILGENRVGHREAVILECLHPRTTLVHGDRPDYRIEVAFDRVDGVITRLIESMGATTTRDARVIAYETDVRFPDGTFELAVPEDARILY